MSCSKDMNIQLCITVYMAPFIAYLYKLSSLEDFVSAGTRLKLPGKIKFGWNVV